MRDVYGGLVEGAHKLEGKRHASCCLLSARPCRDQQQSRLQTKRKKHNGQTRQHEMGTEYGLSDTIHTEAHR